MKGIEDIKHQLDDCYLTVIKWQKNFFDIPKGEVGEKFLKKVVTLLQLFNDKTGWESIALLALHVFIPLMLQKPSTKSKNRDHLRYLEKRLKMWKNGELTEIMLEGEEIQKKMKQSK